MRMKNTIILILLVILGGNMIFSQDREAATWYFGHRSGIDFNSLRPRSVNQGLIRTQEGSAVMSDENGGLLFYTNGVESYTNTHRLASGSRALLGSYTSTQSALIVPRPKHPGKFFTFTTSEFETADTVFWKGAGLNYFNTGRTGTINSKVNHLITYDPNDKRESFLKCSQKLTAIKDPCDDVYWLITHFKDTFYAFKIDENGVNPNPVASKIGPNMFLDGYFKNAKGQLKASPDGTKLGMANLFNNFDKESHAPGSLYLFDFDVTSGMVSNSVQLMDNDFVFAYGVEFSPDSKKVYATVSSFRSGHIPPSGNSNNGSLLAQIDLEDNYRYRKIFESPHDPTALQLSIDGKIYQAHENRRELGVINNPKEKGNASNYVKEGFFIGGLGVSRRGLPSFVQSYFQVRVDFEEACMGQTTKLSTNYLPNPDRIDWDFGDGSQLLNSLDKNPEHTYPSAGSYVVSAKITKGVDVETYTKQIEVVELPNASPVTLKQCDLDGDGISEFNLHEAGRLINTDPTLIFRFFYTERQARAGASEILDDAYSFSNSLVSQVYVRVQNESGCYRITTLDLEVLNTNIPEDFMIPLNACDDLVEGTDIDGIGTFDLSSTTASILSLFPADPELSVSYFESSEDALSEINGIDPLEVFRNKKSPFKQDIWVRIDGTQDNACFGLGHHITLYIDPAPSFELEEEVEVCLKQLPYTASILNPQNSYTYEWVDEEGTVLGSNQSYPITKPGTYTAIATKIDGTNCSTSKNITLSAIKLPIITDVIVDGIISQQTKVAIELDDFNNVEFNLDDPYGQYQDSNIFLNVPPGFHTAYIKDKNDCEVIEETFSVIGHPAFFTPNNDGINDYWQIQGVNRDFNDSSLIYIYDRYGSLLAQVDPASLGWNGSYNGQLLPSSDYWFSVSLEDGREFNGHFTLKR